MIILIGVPTSASLGGQFKDAYLADLQAQIAQIQLKVSQGIATTTEKHWMETLQKKVQKLKAKKGK